jgi:hypothetical protein
MGDILGTIISGIGSSITRSTAAPKNAQQGVVAERGNATANTQTPAQGQSTILKTHPLSSALNDDNDDDFDNDIEMDDTYDDDEDAENEPLNIPNTNNDIGKNDGKEHINDPMINMVNASVDIISASTLSPDSSLSDDMSDTKKDINDTLLDVSIDLLAPAESTTVPEVNADVLAKQQSNDVPPPSTIILTEKEKKVFNEVLTELTHTNVKINTITGELDLTIIADTGAITNLRSIMAKYDKSNTGYVSIADFKQCITEYDNTYKTNILLVLTRENEKNLTAISEYLHTGQNGGGGFDSNPTQKINYILFLKKLAAVNNTNIDLNTSNSSDNSTIVSDNSVRNDTIQPTVVSSLDSNENNLATTGPVANVPATTTNIGSSLASSFVISMPKVSIPKVSIPKVSIPNLGVSDAFSSMSNAATNATNSISAAIFTPSEQMVRDKLITEVSNIARNPDGADTVNTFTGVINRDMTHGDLVIDSKTVMSDVSKKLDGIPDMASKIAYVNKLTAMVNKYSEMLHNDKSERSLYVR